VPLLLSVPGLETNGTTIDHPIGHVDLVPTLLDAMDQPLPRRLQGQSWMPYLRGEGDLDREDVFVEYNGATAFGMHDRSSPTHPDWDRPAPEPEAAEIWAEMGFERDVVRAMTTPVRSIVTPDGWKLNYRRSGEHELYDLSSDPHETENLADDDDYADLLDDLYQRIVDWQRETRDPVYL
jgi:arylsulfatase A-like enzyme